jgi:hypothetical protein
MTFQAVRVARSHSFMLARSLENAFPLFTPEGEREWAPGWDPAYLYPRDGRAEPGMVFTTAHGGESTLWTMTRYEPANGVVEYFRATPGARAARVLVQCAALDASRTRVTVIYEFTGLSESGNAWIREMNETKYGEFIESWRKAIETMPAYQK